MLKKTTIALLVLTGLNVSAAKGGLIMAKEHINYKFGGRLMFDGAYYDDDKVDMQSGTEVRRARMYFAGKLKENWDFILQVDYAGNKSTIKAAHIGYSWNNSKLTLGNQLPPFSLQLQTSSKWQTFTTRATPVLTLNPDNSFGLSYKTHSDKFFFKTGVYGGTASNSDSRERFILGARLTTARNLGKSLNHLGLSYLHTEREESAFKSSSETHVSGYSFIDTDTISNRSSDRIAAEYAYVNGSLSAQAEYFLTDVRGKGLKKTSLDGYYGFVSWFPTGDTRRYSKSSGAFGEIKPNKEFGKGGSGAIEVAARYSSLDMTGKLNGGKQDNIAAEINWYPGGGLKFMLNHTMVSAEKDNIKDEPSITQFRAQVTF